MPSTFPLAVLYAAAHLLRCAPSLKIGSFNTFQFFQNEHASVLADTQIPVVSASDIDVLCLQELMTPAQTMGYLSALSSFGGYTHSFSMMDVLAPEDLQTPRTPCTDSEVVPAMLSSCSDTYCRTFMDDHQYTEAYAACMATACPAEFDVIRFQECSNCVGSVIPMMGSLDAAIAFCGAPPGGYGQYLFNLTDGAVIVSRDEYPITNTWSFEIPSWLFIQRRVHIAEISICAETDPENAECTDSIIVGCTHFHPGSDILDDTNMVQTSDLWGTDVTSQLGLNRYQTEYVLNNIMNQDILTTLGREDNSENVFGVFLVGDTNNAQMFDRCSYTDSLVDNCLGEDPSNPFALFSDGGFVDAPDLDFELNAAASVECTFCLDPSRQDFNALTFAKMEASGGVIYGAEASSDLDHILVQQGYTQKMSFVSFQREFMEQNIDGIAGFINETVPMSDHYGVSLVVEFNDPQ